MTHAAIASARSQGPSAIPAPLAPVPPAVPAGRVLVTMPGPGGAMTVYTPRDIAALQARREELSRQLNSADGRRTALQTKLRKSEGADRTGLEQRLTVLDTRIAGLETDIAENGRQLASLDVTRVSSGNAFAWTPASGNRFAANETPIAIIFTIFVLCPLAVSLSRLLWRRSSAPRPAVSNESVLRLERMEQAMDAIAIEVERVSEGQRFVTRILSEGRGAAALNAVSPAMEPLRVGAEQGLASGR